MYNKGGRVSIFFQNFVLVVGCVCVFVYLYVSGHIKSVSYCGLQSEMCKP